MKIGVYGGTFSPPHLGHMAAAKQAAEALGLDRLLLMPAGTPPHKPLPPGSPTAEERLEMTAIAADCLGLPGVAKADDLELRREGKSFTADTLALLREKYPDDELWFLMGTDMLCTLKDWYHPERICALANLAAFSRGEGEREALEQAAEELRAAYGASVTVLDLGEVVDVSSTQVRAALAAGEGRQYLAGPVYGYILRKGLYGTHADLKHLTDDELRDCSLSMVYAKRHKHILGVEEEAVRLARRWGADEELARRAGILHDCTKYLSLDEQLHICREYGIVLDEMEEKSDKLLHSKTGAALAGHIYGQPEEVCRAIFWHTTGRPGMGLLEKIVYLADYIEPNRDFEGLAELRRLCYEDLDAGLAMGLEMSVDDLKRRGVAIHRNTQGALDWIRAQRKGS